MPGNSLLERAIDRIEQQVSLVCSGQNNNNNRRAIKSPASSLAAIGKVTSHHSKQQLFQSSFFNYWWDDGLFCIFTASKKLTLPRIWFRQECWRSGRERTSAPERWPPPDRGQSEWRRRLRWWIVRRRTARDESPCQGGTEACLRLVRDITSSTVGVMLLVRVVSERKIKTPLNGNLDFFYSQFLSVDVLVTYFCR